MTNGFGRPTASRIAPRRNPSVAPAGNGGSAAAEDTASGGNEPTLLDDAQGPSGPEAVEQAEAPTPAEQASAPDTEQTDTAAPAAAQTDTTGREPAPAPAGDDTLPAAAEEAPEAQPDTAEAQPDTADVPKGEDTASSDAPTKPRKARKPRTAPAADKTNTVTAPATTGGTSLVVIGPDGAITVDDSVHVVDLRTIAAETDPHALVTQLTALSGVADSDVRGTAVTAISEAITKVALAN